MNRFNADGLHVPMRHVFVRVNHSKTMLRQVFAVPAKPELVDPARAKGQPGHLNMLEKCRLLVKLLRHNSDVTFAQHGCSQRHGKAFRTSTDF